MEAAAARPGPDPDGLVGRASDLAALTAFLTGDGPTDGGPIGAQRCLVVDAEPGVGTTALLDAAARAAARGGVTVLRASGVPSESGVRHAGLDQLLGPVAQHVAGLDRPAGAALLPALGYRSAPRAPAPVTEAVVALLERVASGGRVVLVVDDLQWVDRPTVDVLAGVVLAGDDVDVRVLAARRGAGPTLLDACGAARHRLEPLDDGSAATLVRGRYPDTGHPVLAAVVRAAGGSPLALLDLPAAMTPDERSGQVPLPAHLALSPRLRAMFADRVLDLPPATRHLLLQAALAADGRIPLDQPDHPHVLAPAERAGLVQLDRARTRAGFRHPLVPATVVHLSTGLERRRAHRALAARYPPHDDRAAWHLAAADGAPDEGVAELLERAADRERAGGDAMRAVRSLVRSAELSPHPEQRARRLVAAAGVSARAVGDLAGASRLLDRVVRDHAGTAALHAAAVTAYVLLHGTGDVLAAHRVLATALREATGAPGTDPDALTEAVHTLALIGHHAARPHLSRASHAAVAHLRPAAAGVHASRDPVGDALRAVAGGRDPHAVERLAAAAVPVDHLGVARPRLLRLAEDARSGTARSGTGVADGVLALALLSTEAFTTGDWRAADAWVADGLRLCREHGLALLPWTLELPRALIHAATGDHDAVARVADRMHTWAAPRHAGAVTHAAHHAVALDALGRGDHETAFRAASAISPPGTLPPHAAHALWVPMDLVEAAVHAGHRTDAAAHVAAMDAAGLERRSGRLALLVAGSRAIAAPELRRDLFAAALTTPDARRWPFDLARIELAYGQRLRRRRAAADARTHLQSALATFRRLGARPWAARTEQELLATSPTKHTSGHAADAHALTPQERQVATLAAAGLANRQIADRLLISPRTVGTHLQHVFVKLAVPNRAGLHHALSAHGSTAPPARGADAHRRDRHARDARDAR